MAVREKEGVKLMTLDILNKVIKENNIPKDVHLLSDSGCECGPTEMDGFFYHRGSNTIVFTQRGTNSEYEKSGEWEILYNPELIKLEGLEAYPVKDCIQRSDAEKFAPFGNGRHIEFN